MAASASALAFARGAFAADAVQPKPSGSAITLPPPITPAERLQRIAQAQRLMRSAGLKALLIEAGSSLVYFTGVQWHRSERLTTIAAYRETAPQIAPGMTPADIGRIMSTAMATRGATPEFTLILLGEASAYPHGSGKPQEVRPGEVVLMDCGCSVGGYQSDISRTMVMGEATKQQRDVWDLVRRVGPHDTRPRGGHPPGNSPSSSSFAMQLPPTTDLCIRGCDPHRHLGVRSEAGLRTGVRRPARHEKPRRKCNVAIVTVRPSS